MKGGGPALVIGIGKPKKGMGEEADDERDDSAGDSDEGGSDADMHLEDAFDALKSGDKTGFVEAMKKCLLANEEGAYSGPGDEDEG